MLPLTPSNNYTPTIIFCGGSDMPESAYGDYGGPAINTWEYPASNDCQRITPEPQDGSQPVYVQDDDMLEGRTMGQFIILPDGKLLVVNGGLNGTAGYSQATGQTPSFDQMPFGESLASGPVGTPALYDPDAPPGQRWTNKGFDTSSIPRLYHSTAILLPDASVLIAGSNPNIDVNLTTIFPTTYKAEIFYPSYFSAANRPTPSGIPNTLSYGGDPFDITIPPSSYSGLANDAADKTKVALMRGGFNTHAMNMGQRYLQLNNTYTVNEDQSITLHVAQPPPNPFIFQPGPGFVFVVIDGIPSNGSYVIVGNGQLGPQPTQTASVLPDSIRRDDVKGGSPSSGNDNDTATAGSKKSTGAIIGGVVGAAAVLGVIVTVAIIFLRRRRHRSRALKAYEPYTSTKPAYAPGLTSDDSDGGHGDSRGSYPFVPLNQDNRSHAWNASTASFGDHTSVGMYDNPGNVGMGGHASGEASYDPYARTDVPHVSGQRF